MIIYIIHNVNFSVNLDKFGIGELKNVFGKSASFVKNEFGESHSLQKDTN